VKFFLNRLSRLVMKADPFSTWSGFLIMRYRILKHGLSAPKIFLTGNEGLFAMALRKCITKNCFEHGGEGAVCALEAIWSEDCSGKSWSMQT
jgi:hypothetical protein